MMKILRGWYKNLNEYLYEHRKLRLVLEYIFTLVFSLISAFSFAYGFRSFIVPEGTGLPLISGGMSGLSQVLIKLFEIMMDRPFDPMMHNQMQSILYFVVNIPLFILSYFKIGKRFTVFSMINVIGVSLFITIIPQEWTIIFRLGDDMIARAIFAGILTGLATSIAVRADHSAGGIDIISIYISGKTKTAMGKYVLMFNTFIVISFTIMSGYATYATTALYTVIYFFTSSMVIDTFCIRNKKVQLQIITDNEQMAKILIHNIPHGCTVVDAKGAYSSTPKKVIFTDISSIEIKQTVKIIKEVDPNAFITVLNAQSVYGKFFIKPLK